MREIYSTINKTKKFTKDKYYFELIYHFVLETTFK